MSTPAIRFIKSPQWTSACWIGTTFRWHATSPPIMGLVFRDPTSARDLFRTWPRERVNADEMEELSVSIFEAESDGRDCCPYVVHIGVSPVVALAFAQEAKDLVAAIHLARGHLKHMERAEGVSALLGQFKREYAIHREFVLAPVTLRQDGKLWVDVELGIVKRIVHFHDTTRVLESLFEHKDLAPEVER